MTATRAPPGNARTTSRSPLACWPRIGAPATPQSRVRPTAPTPLAIPFPLLHRHQRPAPRGRDDLELIHQAPGTWESDAEPPGGGEAVLHRARHIRDPRPVIPRDDDQPAALVILLAAERDGPAPGVHEDVAGDLAHRGGDDRLVARREAGQRRLLARALPGLDHVQVHRDLPADLVSHVASVPARSRRERRALPRGRGRSRPP